MAKGYGLLSGVTVSDLTQFLSGPFATMIMADMGADVIKVERPDRPKASGPYLNGERTYDLSIMRSKRSVTLNLKEELDKKVLLKMVEKADVIIENFKPGTMERMGLGYDVIKEAGPLSAIFSPESTALVRFLRHFMIAKRPAKASSSISPCWILLSPAWKMPSLTPV